MAEPSKELSVRQGGALPTPFEERLNAQRELIKAQLMPPRTDKQGKNIGPATDDETELFLAEAVAMGLDPLSGQVTPIRPERGGPVVPQRRWEGLVAIAQRTGEYEGHVGPLWTDGTRVETKDEFGNLRREYLWQDLWDDLVIPPVAAKVGVWRRGFRSPAWGIATYAAWGMQPVWGPVLDKDDHPVPKREKVNGKWQDVRDDRGNVVYKQAPTGELQPKASPWWQMPKMPHQLALRAFTIALKSAFQPDVLRKATMAAAEGMTREERLAFASELLGRDVTTFNSLEPSEYAEVYDGLQGQRQGAAGIDYETGEVLDDEVDPFVDIDGNQPLPASRPVSGPSSAQSTPSPDPETDQESDDVGPVWDSEPTGGVQGEQGGGDASPTAASPAEQSPTPSGGESVGGRPAEGVGTSSVSSWEEPAGDPTPSPDQPISPADHARAVQLRIAIRRIDGWQNVCSADELKTLPIPDLEAVLESLKVRP